MFRNLAFFNINLKKSDNIEVCKSNSKIRYLADVDAKFYYTFICIQGDIAGINTENNASLASFSDTECNSRCSYGDIIRFFVITNPFTSTASLNFWGDNFRIRCR